MQLGFSNRCVGSLSTQAKPHKKLTHEGLLESQIDRLLGKIGLDIYAQSHEEIVWAKIALVVHAHQKRQPDFGCGRSA